ncbi:MAG: LLM class F420-dependent oxidoreductase [Chloroflexota bacterium]
MQIGVQIPVESIGSDPASMRTFAREAERLGYDYIVLYEHVVGTTPVARPGREAHPAEKPYREVFTTMAFIAGVTERIGLSTAVLVLPQRQTVLAAKQAAEVDALSGGRLRLGVGVGRNNHEYAAMGADFSTRGRRIEEQVAVMRELWSQDWVTFHGAEHHLDGVSLTVPPVQRPIPVWFGGSSAPVLRRIGRIGDGWIPSSRVDNLAQERALLRTSALEAGREPDAIGMEGRVELPEGGPDDWRRLLAWWGKQGASHVKVHLGEGPLEAELERAARFITLARG